MQGERHCPMLRQEPEIMLAAANARITWALNNPRMSNWLKRALRTAENADPIALSNDIEILRQLLIPRTQALVEIEVCARILGSRYPET